MRFGKLLSLLFCLNLLACESQEKPPNILFILADDLGYGELGSYGQTMIETPHLDELRMNGMKFDQFYSPAPVCAPSRYMFLTGLHAGHSYIRSNDEWPERGDVWNYELASKNPAYEGQRPIPLETPSIAKELQLLGYQTALIGKWGLGAPNTDGVPNLHGFDYFYGYNCQRQAHNLYPPHLWENEDKIELNNQLVAPKTKLKEGADPLKEESYQLFKQPEYAPELMHTKAIEFIEARDNDQPFFLYYASPLPHVPLQAPDEWVRYYQKKLGEEEPYLGQNGYFPNRTPNATYAAMISYLDQQVGELIDLLKKEGVYENTLIVFTSDNGPTYAGGVDPEYFNSAGIFQNQYGRTKGFTYEGGIRVPTIISWPGKVEKGSTNQWMGSFYDFFPTFLEAAQSENNHSSDGISMIPTLFNEVNPPSHSYLYWEFPSYKGQQAVRFGKWKGIRKDMKDGNMEVELYDLSVDPAEMEDISDRYPDIVTQIEEIMRKEHEKPENPKFNLPID